MKFKALLTADGVNLLDKRFLPAMDKVGRICLMYLTKEDTMFLHNLSPSFGGSDGVQCIAQFRKDVIFTDYRISSQNNDRIAFVIDIALLHRALRSAVSILRSGGVGVGDELHIQIKLVKKLPSGAAHSLPYLSFETKTLVQVPDMIYLQNLVEKLRNGGDVLSVSITQYGDLHLHVSTSLITVGSEFHQLKVLGVRDDAPTANQNLTPSSRIETAIQRGAAQTVQVSMKHLAKSLNCHLSKPDAAFYGIAPMGACLTMIFQFFIPGTRQMNNSISLHCRLPVLDTGSA